MTPWGLIGPSSQLGLEAEFEGGFEGHLGPLVDWKVLTVVERQINVPACACVSVWLGYLDLRCVVTMIICPFSAVSWNTCSFSSACPATLYKSNAFLRWLCRSQFLHDCIRTAHYMSGANYNLPSQTSFLSTLHLQWSRLWFGGLVFGHVLSQPIMANWWKRINSLFFSVRSMKKLSKDSLNTERETRLHCASNSYYPFMYPPAHLGSL